MATQAKPTTETVPVTVESFTRAESDLYFANVVKEGGFGKFNHRREPAAVENQTVIRLNRDTLYSSVVLDLDAGPATVTLPDAKGSFMSLQLINEDEYTLPTIYKPGPHKITKEQVGTRYMIVGIRTLVDPSDPQDLKRAHALQDALKLDQPGGPGKFEIPNWDAASQKKVREALLTLATTITDTSRSFGTKDEVDPVQHLIGAASAWGANSPKDATYLNFTPDNNDGKAAYRLKVKDVPVDGFWSVIVYNKEGYIPKNDRNVYSYNNLTAKKDADGSVTIQFGGCDGAQSNCIPIVPGWNYMVRLYRPRKEILDGTWKFPAATPVR